MKHLLIVILLVLYNIFPVSGQAPGYMGKRFSFGYNPQIGMCVYNPSAQNTRFFDFMYSDVTWRSFISMTYKHKYNMQYIIKFNKSIGIEVAHWKSYYFLLPGAGSANLFVEGAYYSYPIHQDIHWMNSISYAFKFRKFKEPFAPMGTYFETGFFLIHSVSDLNRTSIPSVYLPPAKERIVEVNQCALSLAYGKQHPLTRHLLFNRSIDLGITYPFHKPYMDPTFDFVEQIEAEMTKRQMRNRIFGSLFLNLTIGISLMM